MSRSVLWGTEHASYELTGVGRALTYHQWKKMGGCSLANGANPYSVLGSQALWTEEFPTLGQIADACPYSGRSLARFAAENMGKNLFARMISPARRMK
jgi:hypothetical protein